MLLKKKGFPYEGDLVLCTVTKIYYNSVFVTLDEYSNQTGMIHISEVSPGRIRNLNDFVSMGKKIVCKVLNVDKKKGHIDLSLRRVNEKQKKTKVEEIKQEQKAEKIIEFVAQELKIDVSKVYEEIMEAISKKYELLNEFFLDIVTEKIKQEKYEINDKIFETLIRVVKERIKPPKVEIKGEFILKSYAPDGVEIIKDAIDKGIKKYKDLVEMKYFGAGRYSVKITSENYKDAENILKFVTETITKNITKTKGIAEFKRADTKNK